MKYKAGDVLVCDQLNMDRMTVIEVTEKVYTLKPSWREGTLILRTQSLDEMMRGWTLYIPTKLEKALA